MKNGEFFLGYILGILVTILIHFSNVPPTVQARLHNVKMADGQTADQFVLTTAIKFFNAGCVDAFENTKQLNAEKYCNIRAEQLGKELANMDLSK